MSTVCEEPEVAVKSPRIGDSVLWWNMADRNVQPLPGVVCSSGINLMVEIVTWGAQEPAKHRVSVPHIGDTRLLNNIELRRGGAWDYAPNPLRERLIELEKLVIELSAPFK